MSTPGAQSQHPPREDVAIVGMACIVPGADSTVGYWENIVHKVDCIGQPPPDWQPEHFQAGPLKPDGVYVARGGFLGDLCRFNPARYGIMPSSVDGAEPDQFLAFRVAYEAMQDAGYPEVPFNRQKAGVIIGRGIFVNRGMMTMFTSGYLVDEVINLLKTLEPQRSDEDLRLIRQELMRGLPPFNAETVPGLTHNILAGRIANRLDLQGPAYMVDAACASTLLAVEQALAELAAGRCELVIVGGVQVSNPGMVHQAFCYLEALSRQGKIAPFSAEASGTLLGQGCGALVLVRKSDAVRNGQRIYALLKSVGVSSDGKGSGILAPRQAGQVLAIKRAYEAAGLSPDTIGLIEAHGTGIPLGDATEIHSLAECFGHRRTARPEVAVGSVKSMIGHLIPASGAASLIKTALALYHRVLPPMLHAERPNPELELEKTPLYLSTETRPWIHGASEPRRAGVNAFGFGGINAHAILEEPPPIDEVRLPRYERRWPAELVMLSADDRPALAQRAAQLAEWVRAAGGCSLLDLAAALAESSPVGSQRLAIVAADRDDLAGKLARAAQLLGEPARQKIQDKSGIFWFAEPLAQTGRLAFLFPGEGAQYPYMLAELCRHFCEVRREFDLTDRAFLASRVGRPLSRLIFPLPDERQEAENELLGLGGAVTSVTLASRALAALLRTLGITPQAIVGHSSGEFGALMAAGAIAPRDDEALVAALAAGAENAFELATSGAVPPATLLTVGGTQRAAVERVLAEHAGRLVVAMDNCPSQVVLSGDEEAAIAAQQALRGKGGLVERLPWGRAYHTPQFSPALAIMEKFYASIPLAPPRIEIWSCATAERYPDDAQGVARLALEQWHSPVRFRETIEAIYAAGVRLFVEVGPRGNLTAFTSDTLGQRPHLAVPLDLPRKSGIGQLCRALGLLAAHHVAFDLAALYRRRQPRAVDLAAPPPAAAAADPRLPLELPQLRISPKAAAAWQEKLAPAAPLAAPAAKRPQAAPAPDLAPTTAAGTPAASSPVPLVAAAAAEAVTRPAAADSAPGPAAADQCGRAPGAGFEQVLAFPAQAGNGAAGNAACQQRRAAAYADYQQTMQQFLQLQKRAMLRALGNAEPAVQPAGQDAPAPALAVPGLAPPQPSAEPPLPVAPETPSDAPPARLPRQLEPVLAGAAGQPQASRSAAPAPAAAEIVSQPGPAEADTQRSPAGHPRSAGPSPPPPSPGGPQRLAPRIRPRTPRFGGRGKGLPLGGDGGSLPASFNERLIEIVSQRTGYPSDMLDLDANLEADLGIDSIKRVEVIGAFRREVLPSLAELADAVMERLTSAKTLRAILDTVIELSRENQASVPASIPLRPAAPPSPDRKWPFIEHVLVHEPHQRLIAECELDVKRHRFLLDHTFFGRQLSSKDPELRALPIMPLAMTLEMMAEAAQYLMPDLQIVALTDVQTTRWLSFETDTRRVRMEASLADEAHVHVVISEADREGYSAAIATGTIELGYTGPDLGGAMLVDSARTPANWATRIYDWILFHGPAFQGIDRLEACDADAVRAIVHEPDRSLLMTPGEPSSLLLPVGLVDVATQVPGMIYGDWSPSDREVHMVFPNSFGRLEWVHAPEHRGPLTVVGSVRRDGQYLHTAFEVKTPQGKVVLRATDRVCQVVDFPTGIHHYSKSPLEVTCSRDITELFTGVPGVEHVTVAEVAHATGPALLNRLWSQVLSRMILSRNELKLFAELKMPPAAAASWLAGRVVAKDAVRLRVKDPLYMADIEIVPNADGRPDVIVDGHPSPLLSLGHKDFAAVAAAGDPAALGGVGIDIESLGAMYPGLVDDSFNEHERALIDAAARRSGEPFDNWRLAAWAAKEAVGKALGRGVLGGPRSVEVLDIDAQRGRLALALRGQMAKAFQHLAPTPDRAVPVYAYRRIRGPHVIALCLLGRNQP